MIKTPGLSEREELILEAVVISYITSAEPVGSRTIVKRFGLDVSPATVRNTMADLEEAGYLSQVHTSSGRVPTDLGYRYYVDRLMPQQDLNPAERDRIQRDLSQQLDDADGLLRHTSHMLAQVTHQAGIVEAPDEASAELRCLDLMPVPPSRMAVIVADSLGRVKTVVATVDALPGPEELGQLTRFLNDELRGVPLDQLAASFRQKMDHWLDERRLMAERAIRLLDSVPATRAAQLFLEGASQLFEQPEFADLGKAREVFGLLDESGRILEVLRTGMRQGASPKPLVLIGAEAGNEPALHEISLVAMPYCVEGRTVGVVGVLGPRRMPYPRLTAVVGYTADLLGQLLTKLSE